MARILIIDDEEDVRAALVHILERDGHMVVEAGDGNEGLRRFRETPTDLVITDILMPDKEGIETIKDLRKIAPDLKIIAISGGGRIMNTSFLDLAEMLGADMTLKKPFQIDQFCKAVDDCLGAARRAQDG